VSTAWKTETTRAPSAATEAALALVALALVALALVAPQSSLALEEVGRPFRPVCAAGMTAIDPATHRFH
jgi:hypothetical protein